MRLAPLPLHPPPSPSSSPVKEGVRPLPTAPRSVPSSPAPLSLSARARVAASDEGLRRLLASGPPPHRTPSSGVCKRTPSGGPGVSKSRGVASPARPRAARALVLEVVPPFDGRTVGVQTDDDIGVKVCVVLLWVRVEKEGGRSKRWPLTPPPQNQTQRPHSPARSPLKTTQAAHLAVKAGAKMAGAEQTPAEAAAPATAPAPAPAPAAPNPALNIPDDLTAAGDDELRRLERELAARCTQRLQDGARAVAEAAAAAAAAAVAASQAATQTPATGSRPPPTTPARGGGGTQTMQPTPLPAARVPPRGVAHTYHQFRQQAQACDWADAVAALAAEQEEADGGGGAAAASTTTTALTFRSDPVKVFCVQTRAHSGNYYRHFVAAGTAALHASYFDPRSIAAGRHWYEVLRAGRPVHAYFDLEYDRSLNPAVDGDTVADTVIAAFARAAVAAGVPPAAVADAAAFESDASDAAKWSRHLVIRVRGAAWRDAEAVGRLVDAMLADNATVAALAVRKPPPKNAPPDTPPLHTVAIDTGVYTRNRHFRMLWSSKGGSDRVLRPTQRHAFGPGGVLDVDAPTARVDAALQATLASDVAPGTRLFDVEGSAGGVGGASYRRVATIERTAQAAVPGEGRSIPVVIKLTEDEVEAGHDVPPAVAAAALRAVPAVQRQVTSLARAQAHVVKVVLCGATATKVSYNMQGERDVWGWREVERERDRPTPNTKTHTHHFLSSCTHTGPGGRHCAHSLASNGRPHKSNFAYYVCDLATGGLTQRCFDADCRGVAAPVGELPVEYRYVEGGEGGGA